MRRVAHAFLIGALALGACGRKPPPPPPPAPAKPPAEARVVSTREGDATWYEPPADSLAVRRAPGELTAASDTLPPGTLARVTRLDDGRFVSVRVTDHGIHRRGGLIDLCKEAASEIGLVSEGVTRVRVEELANDSKPAR